MDFLSNVASEKFSSLPVCEERGGLNPSLRAKLTRVRAMYRTAATLCGGRRKACLLARAVHAQLLRHFNLTAQQLPLLELNISEIVGRCARFRLSPCLSLELEYFTKPSADSAKLTATPPS